MHRILAGIEFRTNKEIVEHARSIKLKYKDGEKIVGQDDLFLREFVALHPRSSEKIGCGVAYFTTQIDEHWKNSRQFVLVRTNGERVIFSHNQVRATEESPEERHRGRVLKAMREAIVSQIIEFRNENFMPGKTRCPLTNEIIEEPHVDHEKPQTFLALALEWLDINGLLFSDVSVSSDSDRRTFEVLSNSTQLSSWQRYHAVHARLRILSKEGNLSLARRA